MPLAQYQFLFIPGQLSCTLDTIYITVSKYPHHHGLTLPRKYNSSTRLLVSAFNLIVLDSSVLAPRESLHLSMVLIRCSFDCVGLLRLSISLTTLKFLLANTSFKRPISVEQKCFLFLVIPTPITGLTNNQRRKFFLVEKILKPLLTENNRSILREIFFLYWRYCTA